MSDISDFIAALEAAQGGKFTQEVQDAAKGIDVATLKTAVAEALEASETDKIADDSNPKAVALRAGFEFAAKVVMMLKTAPGPFEKKDLYVHFKVARGDDVPKPGMFDMVVSPFLFCAAMHVLGAWAGKIPTRWFLFVCARSFGTPLIFTLFVCRRSSSTASGRRLSITATRSPKRSTSSMSTTLLASTAHATSNLGHIWNGMGGSLREFDRNHWLNRG